MQEEVAGEPPTFRRIVFTQTGPDTAAQELQATDADGKPIGEPAWGSSTWLDLQRHASQPADATTVSEVALVLPFGQFDCWLYIVRRPAAEVRFWFAKELPGMPVQIEEWVDGALAARSLMIANEVSSADAGTR